MRPTNGDRDHAYYRDLLAAYALGAVPPAEERAVAAHVAACETCHAEVADLQAVVQILPLALEELEPPPTLRDAIQAAVWREVAAAGRPRAGEGAAGDFRPQTGNGMVARPPTRHRAHRPFVVPWAAVAALLLVASLGLLGWSLRFQHALR